MFESMGHNFHMCIIPHSNPESENHEICQIPLLPKMTIFRTLSIDYTSNLERLFWTDDSSEYCHAGSSSKYPITCRNSENPMRDVILGMSPGGHFHFEEDASF